ncbi:hypothetical protein, partial [Nocardia fusca]|uniref:hypothetical protein n=1 Tax=Nocardia fusca TaxID=941183 RepID=UPI001E46119D
MSDDDMARLSPFVRAHIGIDGHYSFHLPDLERLAKGPNGPLKPEYAKRLSHGLYVSRSDTGNIELQRLSSVSRA